MTDFDGVTTPEKHDMLVVDLVQVRRQLESACVPLKHDRIDEMSFGVIGVADGDSERLSDM